VRVSDTRREFDIPVSKLAPASVEQAKRIAKVVNVYQRVRDGQFDMGSPDDEKGRDADETLHTVHTGAFLMKTTEVTWLEWNAVRKFGVLNGYTDLSKGSNGARGNDADLNPVVEISWWDAVKWCNLKSHLEGLEPAYRLLNKQGKMTNEVFKTGTGDIGCRWDGPGYRLPTEAEWEFACRTRNSKWEFHTGPIRETGLDPPCRNLSQAGWYGGNSAGKAHPVAGKDPNAFGLHDLHGNVAEWCWDVNYGPLGAQEAHNPRGLLRGDQRVIRGGSWNDPASECRAAARSALSIGGRKNTVGFRIVRSR
jgi:formylglycine-generating enzyme required for sulfatase activity